MMTKKKWVFVLFVLVIANAAVCQKPSSALSISSVSNAGLVNGSAGPSVSLQTILGLTLNNSFAGVGAGIDYYRFRSLPVFLDVRHSFGTTKDRFFLYGDLGYNFNWLSDKNKQQVYYYQDFDYTGGVYFDVGAGYRIAFKKRDALLLSAGYSVKKFSTEGATSFCPFVGPCSPEKDRYVYSLPRLMIKAGWQF